jgi:hypothetical protein
MKRYTTQGMAPDQGKNSNIAALAVWPMPRARHSRDRHDDLPPALRAGADRRDGRGRAGQGLRARAPHHVPCGPCARWGAPMIEAGLWYRPSYVPRDGRDPLARVLRPRGRVWCARRWASAMSRPWARSTSRGRMRRLSGFRLRQHLLDAEAGRVRYGLMLREDGHVMDDGTTARLGEDHYVMTTTTAAAGQVMRIWSSSSGACGRISTCAFIRHRAMGAVRHRRTEIARAAGGGCSRSAWTTRPSPSWLRRGGHPRHPRPPVPHLVLRASMPTRSRCPRATARRSSRPRGPGRGAGRRGLRDGGAERAAAREGLHHPCRDPWTRDGGRYRHGPHGASAAPPLGVRACGEKKLVGLRLHRRGASTWGTTSSRPATPRARCSDTCPAFSCGWRPSATASWCSARWPGRRRMSSTGPCGWPRAAPRATERHGAAGGTAQVRSRTGRKACGRDVPTRWTALSRRPILNP